MQIAAATEHLTGTADRRAGIAIFAAGAFFDAATPGAGRPERVPRRRES